MWEWLDEFNHFLMILIKVDIIDASPLKNQTVVHNGIAIFTLKRWEIFIAIVLRECLFNSHDVIDCIGRRLYRVGTAIDGI